MQHFLSLLSFSLLALLLNTDPALAQTSFAEAKLVWSLPWDADWVTAVSFVGTNKLAAGNKLGDILLWDLPDEMTGPAPHPACRLAGHTNEITRLLTMPDQRTLISASNDHTIKYWDVQAPAGIPESVVLNARARAEAEASKNKKKQPAALEAKVLTQKFSRELLGHKDWVQGLGLSHDGRTLVSGDDQGEVIVWDAPAAKEIRRWRLKGWAWGLGVSPEGQSALIAERIPLVFDAGSQSGLKLWNVPTGTMKVDLGKEFKERMAAVAYSPDGKWLAAARGGEVAGLNGKISLLDPATGKKLRDLAPGHQEGATDLAFHPDGKHLFSSGRDTLVKIWRLDNGKHIRDLGKARGGQFKDWICAISISPDGKRLAAADMAGQVHIWALSK